MTAAKTLPDASAVEGALLANFREEVVCVEDGEYLRLDTPYTLQDGHLLRAYVGTSDDGSLLVTDRGWACSQIETFARSDAVRRQRYGEMRKIARQLGLAWDVEFSFRATDLRSATLRLAVLARAVDLSLSLIHGRPSRRPVALRQRLRDELRDAGLQIQANARISIGGEPKPVIVDHLVRRNGSQAAVEVLTGRTDGGALISVDRAIANFHLLSHFRYPGFMIAVYDEASPAGDPRLRDRFENARPVGALLYSGSEAVKAIQAKLLHS